MNIPPVNDYDFDTVRRTAELIREAPEVLKSSEPINLRQRREVESKVQILETQLVKECCGKKSGSKGVCVQTWIKLNLGLTKGGRLQSKAVIQSMDKIRPR